ncbi:N-acetylmuramoyl-L-alanine amidase [Tianweitania populi]|uniref:N-acetylmuramoyl-L-alanine amidase n=1 Tax=Tianweitania populi TaxID=1607949 RepID=A0A8J3GJV8_9HYPH|nr:N-acetylmuramoyl-L-alanine amidase [Tianweitania populi]GHD08840.1 N-acetylmuramoyl-L-alanine amidase [Tianweitania populi]
MNFRIFEGVRTTLNGAVLALGLGLALSIAQPATAKPLELRDLAIAGDSLKTRMLFSLDVEAEPKLMLLRSPHRLVIDLPEARFRFDEKALKPRGLITGIKYGPIGEGMSRIVVSAKGPFKIVDFNMLANEEKAGNRMVLDLEAASEQLFDAALAEQATSTGSTTPSLPKNAEEQTTQKAEKRFTVVIDPGHGGIDGGANGLSGTVEKDITLAFSRELRDQLAKVGDLDIILTRDGDQFLRLDERVRFAREKNADLFISIHADTIRLKGISGATVYTVSDRASDAASAALATRENLSDQLAGIKIEDEDHQIADILVDLIRRETHSFSMSFAKTLVGELKQSVTMINNPHRMAGFRVLRAPDVPSVLIELGYLSNESDEKHLLDSEWRSKAAKGIVDAVVQFAGPRIGSRG